MFSVQFTQIKWTLNCPFTDNITEFILHVKMYMDRQYKAHLKAAKYLVFSKVLPGS